MLDSTQYPRPPHPPRGAERLRRSSLVGGLACSLVLIGGLSVWSQGCANSSGIELCKEIPTDGCPMSRGGSCDDESCAALYSCVDGFWKLVETCSSGGPGGGGAGAGGGSGGVGAAGGCGAASIDKTNQAQGCMPALQSPDCPVEAPESCAPCVTGCIDFFMCVSDGWQVVAYCTEEGDLVVEP